MILIADSGSSKTDFNIIDAKGKISSFTTSGLSPFFVNSNTISYEIKKNYPENFLLEDIQAVFFYGAGCSSEDRIGIVHKGLNNCFKNAEIEINTDLYGAALATFGNSEGLVAILGTGSNSCYWDGYNIIQSSPSLGYILGDEGSGAVLGKVLLTLLLNGELPPELESQFYNTYDISQNDILDGIYRKEKPNSFMASFTYFWVENLHHPYVKYVVNNCFLRFFEKNIIKYPDYDKYQLRCVGSIAHYFNDILIECALAYNIKIDSIVRQPIHGLSKYFLEKMDIRK
ncbi:MAG: hypothetical protein IPO21_18435 [Bacteroidales bacterium]|nr:hypothetical protein [Bacteroidales bacterium]